MASKAPMTLAIAKWQNMCGLTQDGPFASVRRAPVRWTRSLREEPRICCEPALAGAEDAACAGSSTSASEKAPEYGEVLTLPAGFSAGTGSFRRTAAGGFGRHTDAGRARRARGFRSALALR